MSEILNKALVHIFNADPPPYRREAMVGDASSRRYERLFFEGRHPTLKSVVLMWLPSDALKAEEASSGPAPYRLPFLDVQAYLEQGNIPVPSVLADFAADGLIVLEDLGTETLERTINRLDGDPERILRHYEAAIDLLVEFQAHGDANPDRECIAFKRAFDSALFRWELEHFIEYGLVARTGISPSSEDAAALARIFDSIAERLASEEAFLLVHRDFQSRNLMFRHGSLVLIDFQDALMGPIVYDLAALLRDSYISLTPSVVEHLLDYFQEKRIRKNMYVPDRKSLKGMFLLQTVQRKLKDAGRFVFIDKVKGNPSFLPYVSTSLGYVAEALRSSGEDDSDLRELAAILPRYCPELSQ